MGRSMSTIMRYLAFIPSFMYGYEAISKATNQAKNPAVFHPPYNSHIRAGEICAAVVGTLLIVWNFVFWIPSATAQSTGLLLLGILDLLFVAGLLASLIIQSTYVPLPIHACRSVAETWQVPANTSSMFRITSPPNANATTVMSNCNDYHSEWWTGFAVLLLYIISATFSIHASGWWKKNSDITSKSMIEQIKTAMKGLLTFGIAIPVVLFWLIPHNILKSLLELYIFSIRPPSRFVIRYLKKRLSRSKHNKEIQKATEAAGSHRSYPNASSEIVTMSQEMQEMKGIKGAIQVTTSALSLDCKLSELPYDILVLICQNMHGIDVLHLSLTSKAMRQFICGSVNDSRQKSQLKSYSCFENVKSACWSCGVQICPDCAVTSRCEGTRNAKHCRRCKSVCSKCYFKHVFHSRKKASFKDTTCGVSVCNLKTQAQREEPDGLLNRLVCLDCSTIRQRDMRAMRTSRDTQTIQQLTVQPEDCYKCHKKLNDSGPRWWMCSICDHECPSYLHPQWAEEKTSPV